MSRELEVRGAVIASYGALGAVLTVALHRGARARRAVRAVHRGPGPAPGVQSDTRSGPGLDGTALDVASLDVASLDGATSDAAGFDQVGFDTTEFDTAGFDAARFDAAAFDDATRSALTACLFASAPDDHICWTILVVDPALHDTPSHLRLVGHYESEISAVDAADHLARELNSCLVPGEAPLTATAIGIEPQARSGDGIVDLVSAADWLRPRGPAARTDAAVSYRGPIGDLGRSSRT